MSLFGDVRVKRLRRLQSLLLQGKSPKDMRGKGNKNRAHSEDSVRVLHDHIASYPVTSSHYSSREYRFLSSGLSCQKMYGFVKEKYPNSNITYKYYVKYFKQNFDLSFGPPQIDTCIKCEELTMRIKRPFLNLIARKAAEAELEVHKRRSKKYFSVMTRTALECKSNPEILGLCFDYCQNLPLPKIPVQDIFYMRQLWVNVFGIHNMQTTSSVLYAYHESKARKGANEVCRFLLDYIKRYVPKSVKELRLFSDGAVGQNKNHTVIRLCAALVDTKRFETIHHYFPMRGHSYNACDRDFAIIKRSVKQIDRIYDVKQYCEIILRAPKRHDKFTIILVETSDIHNFSAWWPKFYKRGGLSDESRGRGVPTNFKIRFQSASFMHFLYSANDPGTVRTKQFINGPIKHTFRLHLVSDVQLPNELAYDEPIPIDRNKMNDLKRLEVYIPREYKDFFNEILAWPTVRVTDDDCD